MQIRFLGAAQTVTDSKCIRHLQNILATFCFLLSTHALANGLTLTDYLRQVQDANPTLQAVKAAAEKAQFYARPASTWDDPFIGLGIDEKPTDGGIGGVKRYQISQTIPFPGKNSARSAIASYEAESAKSDIETSVRQIRVLATQIYFKTYLNRKAIELNQELHGILQTIADSSKARYQSGSYGHHEWILSQVELNILEVEELRLLREKKSLTAVFNEMRNQPVQTNLPNLSFEYKEPPGTVSQSPDWSTQPELRSIDLSARQASEEARLAKLSYFPDLVLQGMMMDPQSEMMSEKKSWGVMLGMNLPIFFWRKQSDLADAASAQKRIAEFERQSLRNRVSTEWLEAGEQLKTSKDVVKLYQTSVLPSSRLAVQSAKTSYSARKLSLDQYLYSLKIQRMQEIELMAAQMDVYLSDLRLKELLSSPTLIRLSPGRPSLFGGGSMGSYSDMGSATVDMGSRMSGPTRRTKSAGTRSTGGSGMEGM
jgi:outer membrane protein TolC